MPEDFTKCLVAFMMSDGRIYVLYGGVNQGETRSCVYFDQISILRYGYVKVVVLDSVVCGGTRSNVTCFVSSIRKG